MNLKRISNKAEISNKDSWEGYLVDAGEKETRKIIQSLKDSKINKKIILVGRDDAFNRRAIETLNIDYLISPERGEKKDSLKQRDSGINHVVAKEAAKKKIPIVIDFDEIISLNGKERALRLSKIQQNIKICRKVNCPIRILDLSGRSSLISLKAFGISLGMSSGQTRDCIKL
jgi:ribonuclease P/MRP protein subunit RPP1